MSGPTACFSPYSVISCVQYTSLLRMQAAWGYFRQETPPPLDRWIRAVPLCDMGPGAYSSPAGCVDALCSMLDAACCQVLRVLCMRSTASSRVCLMPLHGRSSAARMYERRNSTSKTAERGKRNAEPWPLNLFLESLHVTSPFSNFAY